MDYSICRKNMLNFNFLRMSTRLACQEINLGLVFTDVISVSHTWSDIMSSYYIDIFQRHSQLLYSESHLSFCWCVLHSKEATSKCKNQYLAHNRHFILDIIYWNLTNAWCGTKLSVYIYIYLSISHLVLKINQSREVGPTISLLKVRNWGSERSCNLPIITQPVTHKTWVELWFGLSSPDSGVYLAVLHLANSLELALRYLNLPCLWQTAKTTTVLHFPKGGRENHTWREDLCSGSAGSSHLQVKVPKGSCSQGSCILVWEPEFQREPPQHFLQIYCFRQGKTQWLL